MSPDSVSVPAPALVSAAEPLIIPVIVPTPLFVMLNTRLPEVARAILAALSCAVVIVRPVSGVLPTAPVNVVLPVVLVVSVFAPETVLLNNIAPPAVLVSAVAEPNVTASL